MARETTGSENRYVFQGMDAVTRWFSSRTADKQAAFFLPYLRSGMSLLDCGCGPGSITIGLARAVAPGKVVGLDIQEEQVRLARECARVEGVANVEFKVADILDIPFPDGSYDAVFTNAVIEHLREPTAALQEVRRVLKIGGVAGVRDVDHDGDLFSPEDELFRQTIEIFVGVTRSSGADPTMGKYLRSMLRRAGFSRVRATASYDTFDASSGLRLYMDASSEGILNQGYIDQVTRLGLADLETLKEISHHLDVLGDDPDFFAAFSYCEAVGWKG